MHWRDKAQEMIAEMCWQSYKQAGNNAKRKRHKPYSIPLNAERLIVALNANDEETAKAIMLYLYTIPDAKKD